MAAIATLSFPTSAASAPPYPDAVVLVSGFDTQTPFTTPDPACSGKEGEAWDPPTGVAAALKTAGRKVFTAPVRQGGEAGLAPCNPDGPAPPRSDYIDSNGELDANGTALAGFLAFLQSKYGVQRVQLVGHSDGGLWSRAAITQRAAYAGVSIQSLTTLGTPHTGSFVADLAIETEGGRCDFEEEIEQDLCRVFQLSVEAIVKDIGRTATEELTNDFLATWNPKQEIGTCPVTGIAGTYVDVPLLPLTYYNPDDGLVGEASALARSAFDLDLHEIPSPGIPNFKSGGTYPVVHGASISALSKETLLNTPAISQKVAAVVAATSSSGPLCNAADATSAGPPGPPLRLPLTRLVVPSPQGHLPIPGREDAVVVRRGFRLVCGASRTVRALPLLGNGRLRIGHLRGCRRPLGIWRNGRSRRAGALMIRRHPTRDLILRLHGDRARLNFRAFRPRVVRALIRAGGRWSRLPVRRGVIELPAGVTRSALRIRVKTAAGRPTWTATAVLRH